jgi:hypothetical protein
MSLIDAVRLGFDPFLVTPLYIISSNFSLAPLEQQTALFETQIPISKWVCTKSPSPHSLNAILRSINGNFASLVVFVCRKVYIQTDFCGEQLFICPTVRIIWQLSNKILIKHGDDRQVGQEFLYISSISKTCTPYCNSRRLSAICARVVLRQVLAFVGILTKKRHEKGSLWLQSCARCSIKIIASPETGFILRWSSTSIV